MVLFAVVYAFQPGSRLHTNDARQRPKIEAGLTVAGQRLFTPISPGTDSLLARSSQQNAEQLAAFGCFRNLYSAMDERSGGPRSRESCFLPRGPWVHAEYLVKRRRCDEHGAWRGTQGSFS